MGIIACYQGVLYFLEKLSDNRGGFGITLTRVSVIPKPYVNNGCYSHMRGFWVNSMKNNSKMYEIWIRIF